MSHVEEAQKRVEEAQKLVAELEEKIEYFEPEISDEQFRDFLDDVYGDVEICGMRYCSGHALQELDPIAFRVGKSDYCASMDKYDFEQFSEYQEFTEALEEAQNELEEAQNELLDAQNEEEN